MLKSIRIQNFKSLRDVTVDLEPLTVLIGRSGTGKTNFVSAVRVLRDLFHGENGLSGHGGWPHVLRTNGGDALSFDVEFDVPGHDQKFRYGLTYASAQPAMRREELYVDDELVFGVADGKWAFKPDATPLHESVGGPQLAQLQRLPVIHAACQFLARSIGCHQFGGNVLVTSDNGDKPGPLDDLATNALSVFRLLVRDQQFPGYCRELTGGRM
jgi:hypothetical protein